MNREDIELKKYLTDINQEVHSLANAEEEGASLEETFTELMLEILADAGETENARVCTDIKEDKIGRRIHKINGYALSEHHDTVDLFITIFDNTSKLGKVPKTEIEKAARQTVRFLKNVFKGYFQEIEESSPVFDLAHTLHQFKRKLARLNILILSNSIIDTKPPKIKSPPTIMVNFNIWDIQRFYRLWTSTHKREAIEIDFEQGFGGAVPCLLMPSENDEYESYAGIVSGDTLAAAYHRYGARLLERNVRSFLQFTGKVNRGIRDTLRHEPHMFLAFNNGIAATAEHVRLIDIPGTGKAITWAKDFQIVNGGQTISSIFYVQRKDKVDLSNVSVQLKLTVVKNPDHLDNIVPRISRYANTQNKVSEADLTSNNPFHIRLEELSRTIWSPDPTGMSQQTRWFFERARGQYKVELNNQPSQVKRKAFEALNPRKQVFKKEELAKYYNTWAMLPYIVVKGSQKNYLEFIKSMDEKLPDKVFFEDSVSKAILFKTAEKEYGIGKKAMGNLRYLVVPYTLALLNRLIDGKLDLHKIWQEQTVPDNLRYVIIDMLHKINDFLKTPASGNLIAEWAKKEDCWKQLCNTNLVIDLSLLQDDFISPEKAQERYSTKSKKIRTSQRQKQSEQFHLIPHTTWQSIEIWGRTTKKLTSYQCDATLNIAKKVKHQKDLLESEILTGNNIIRFIEKEAPHLLREEELP